MEVTEVRPTPETGQNREPTLAESLGVADLPRRTLRRVMSKDDAMAMVGTRVPAMPASWEVNNPGLWTDEETGEPVLAITPCPEADALRAAILASQPAIGMGTLRASSGNRNQSVTFGYRPRKPMMSQEGCVLTAFNRDFPDEAAFLAHYSEVLADQLAVGFPEIEVMGREVIEQVLPDWRLSKSSLWTSGVINRMSALPYHVDGNNFEAWSVMPVIRRGVRGGNLHLPEYGVAIPCRDAHSVAFYGRRVVHGVTPMTKISDDGYRISVVFYALRGLKDCHTFAEETAMARVKRTEREDSIAAGRTSLPKKGAEA